MKQFDVVENNSPLTRRRYPFLVVLQHDRIATAATIIVAPLIAPAPGLSKSQLHPPIIVAGRTFLLLTEELAAAHHRSLIASAEADRYAIVAAIDLCFTGI